MNKNNELTIRIDPEGMQIRLESTEDGVTTYKEISPNSFLDCIRNSIRNEKTASGFLPENCFHVTTYADGGRDYCIRHPSLYADITYHSTEYPHFPLPRLVFGFRVSKEGKVSGCRLGVVEDGKLKEDSVMYEYPFSNVASFSLCIGANSLPVYKKAHTLATLPDFLLRLPNNDDRFSPLNNRPNLQYRELLEHLKNKDPKYYYSDILIPSGKTIKDFIGG